MTKAITLKSVSLTVVAAMLMSTVSVQQAQARGGAAFALGAGAVLGIIAGSAIVGASRSRAAEPTRRQRVVVERPQRRQAQKPTVNKAAQIADSNRLTQKALASLGFYDGPIDGASYPATKAAIVQFQAKINEKPTGSLTANQRRLLMANYASSLNNVQPAMASRGNADPLFALLGAGTGAAAVATGVGVVGTINAQGVVTPGQNIAYFRNVCDDVSGSGGHGVVTLTSGADSTFARDQFCVGRQSMLVESSETLASLGQVDVQAVRTECKRIAESMAPKIAMLASDTPLQLSQKLTKDFAGAAAQRQSVITNFKVCLGVGYAEDLPDVVLAAGLGLVGNGLGGYGEAIAGVLGVGKDPYARPAKAAEWLDYSAQQIEKGSPPVKTELGPERSNVLRSTADQLRGKAPRLLAAASQPTAPSTQVEAARPTSIAPPAADFAAPQPVVAAPAPAPAQVPAPAVAAVNPAAVAPPSAGTAADAKAAISSQAVAFFTSEVTEQTRRLETLVVTLGLDKATLPAQCGALIGDAAKPDPTQQDAMMLRVCRSWSYSVANKSQMYAFDQKLARSGDADAASRVLMHILVGNDRAN